MNIGIFRTMPIEQITKAIAECEGYKDLEPCNMYDLNGAWSVNKWQGKHPDMMDSVYPVPDFAESLDLIHLLEMKLTDNQRSEFFWILAQLMAENSPSFDQRKMIFATARQRAEALLHLRKD